jgi:hypothetical protein
MSCIISCLHVVVTGFGHLWIESASFQGNFDSIDLWLRAVALAFAAAHVGGKTVNVPNSTIQKDGFYVNSSSRYDGRNTVNSGRACVHCDNCAGRYYNQEARIA